MNIIDQVQNLIETDEENHENQERHLLESYARVDPVCKRAIDTAFIALCGYGLGTLISGDRAKGINGQG